MAISESSYEQIGNRKKGDFSASQAEGRGFEIRFPLSSYEVPIYRDEGGSGFTRRIRQLVDKAGTFFSQFYLTLGPIL